MAFEFKTIPVAEVPALTTNTLSKEDQATRNQFDNALKALPTGQALSVALAGNDLAKASRSMQMRFRASAKRVFTDGSRGITKMGSKDGYVYVQTGPTNGAAAKA